MGGFKHFGGRCIFLLFLLGGASVDARQLYEVQPYTRYKDTKELGDKHESRGYDTFPWAMPQPSIGGKVSLGGLPMADNAPQDQTPFDYLNESTYIDAFSVDLQHSVTDIHIPVGSGHLALEVRRTLTQEVWGDFGLHPDSRPDKPFGKCWQSNLAPAIHWIKNGLGNGTLNIRDHTGREYTYKSHSGTSTRPPDLTFSSGQSGVDMAKVELNHNPSTGSATLRLANGTVLTYASAYQFAQTQRPQWSADDSDYPYGSWSFEQIKHYHWISRLVRVEDRYGYSNTRMIPEE